MRRREEGSLGLESVICLSSGGNETRVWQRCAICLAKKISGATAKPDLVDSAQLNSGLIILSYFATTDDTMDDTNCHLF